MSTSEEISTPEAARGSAPEAAPEPTSGSARAGTFPKPGAFPGARASAETGASPAPGVSPAPGASPQSSAFPESGTSPQARTSAEIRTLLVTRFGTDPDAIRPDIPLHRLRLDSLALEELRLHIEDRLDVDLEDVALTSRDTVGRLVEVVHGKVSA